MHTGIELGIRIFLTKGPKDIPNHNHLIFAEFILIAAFEEALKYWTGSNLLFMQLHFPSTCTQLTVRSWQCSRAITHWGVQVWTSICGSSCLCSKHTPSWKSFAQLPASFYSHPAHSSVSVMFRIAQAKSIGTGFTELHRFLTYLDSFYYYSITANCKGTKQTRDIYIYID